MNNDEIRRVLSAYCQTYIEQLIRLIEEDEKDPEHIYSFRPTESEDCIDQFIDYLKE